MEELLALSGRLIAKVSLGFKRYLYSQLNWNSRLIGLKGARGTGKTTLLLQKLKELALPAREMAYFSLDEMYFTTHSLLDTAKNFYLQGGKILVLDEVHKYSTWAREIKNLYDRYDDLQIIFTGSSIIDIAKQEADLSRRALMYELKGMSYREYLQFQHQLNLPVITLKQLVNPDFNFRNHFPKDFKPLAWFKDYLQFGYYPFYKNDTLNYHHLLRQLVRTIVEYDMAELRGFDIRHAKKMLQLMYVVSQQVPFKPNINSLAQKTGIHRNSINNYLFFLQEARLLFLLHHQGISTAILQKPEKIFIENTNLLYALSESMPSEGTIRETFFNNQFQVNHQVHHAIATDFMIDGTYSFEIGGKNKSSKQIKQLNDSWVVKAEIEYPIGKTIPLWLVGFLY